MKTFDIPVSNQELDVFYGTEIPADDGADIALRHIRKIHPFTKVNAKELLACIAARICESGWGHMDYAELCVERIDEASGLLED